MHKQSTCWCSAPDRRERVIQQQEGGPGRCYGNLAAAVSIPHTLEVLNGDRSVEPGNMSVKPGNLLVESTNALIGYRDILVGSVN